MRDFTLHIGMRADQQAIVAKVHLDDEDGARALADRWLSVSQVIESVQVYDDAASLLFAVERPQTAAQA